MGHEQPVEPTNALGHLNEGTWQTEVLIACCAMGPALRS